MRLKGAFVLVLALLAAGLSLGADEATPPHSCLGEKPTIVGTYEDDFLLGTVGRDVIWAGPGNDTVLGDRGNDVICGGPGVDFVRGGRNNDIVDGGPGDGDRAYGDLGDDHVTGGPGDGDEAAGNLGIDLVSGGPGNGDYVHGDYGWDRMDGGAGSGDIAAFDTAPSPGVWASLEAGKARGDGRDRLFGFENLRGSAFGDTLIGDRWANTIEGGAGDDLIRANAGVDTVFGGQGSDRCPGVRAKVSCGPEKPLNQSVYVEVSPVPAGGGGLAIVGGSASNQLRFGFNPADGTYEITSGRAVSLGPGCDRMGEDPRSASCNPGGYPRWLIADLGPGDDRLSVNGTLAAVGQVRIVGGAGDDVIHGGPEDDLIESGPGSDRLFGGQGQDALVGGRPGPTWLFGGARGDLLAAGSGCAGGALVGGPGRDNASFAETAAHPGRLIISLPKGQAWIDAIRGCRPVRIDHSNEDIEGSFDNDILIGDRRDNSLLGQPGHDIFYGGGGHDVVNALDRVRDFIIQCGGSRPSGTALIDPGDPAPIACSDQITGTATPGLHHEHD